MKFKMLLAKRKVTQSVNSRFKEMGPKAWSGGGQIGNLRCC